MAGAVDLSGLKQRPAPAGEGTGGAAQPSGVEITEANLEAEVLVRSSQIPVVVLTTSKADTDISKIYELGANSFISKPVSFDSLVEVMKILGRYWFEIVELPAKKP